MSKRFVTYRTEDAKAGLVNVDENGVMKHGGGSGLPTGGEPFKQLVTDADGKTVWADRLAYVSQENKVLLIERNDLEIIIADWQAFHQIDDVDWEIDIGKIYDVVYNGVEYSNLVAFNDGGTPTIGAAYDDGFTAEMPFSVIKLGNCLHIATSVELAAEIENMFSISISRVDQKIKTIDMKFLPEWLDRVIVFDGDSKTFLFTNGAVIRSFEDLHNIFLEMATLGKGKCICRINADGGIYFAENESIFYHPYNNFWRIVFLPVGSDKLSVLVSIQNQSIRIEQEE